MMLDKKQIQTILSSKWVVKQRRQLTKSTTHLAQELLMNVQCSGGSRSFAKEMRALKMRSTVPGHWKLAVTNWEQSSKLILLKLHEKLPKDSTSTIQPFYSHLSFEVKWSESCSVMSHSLWPQGLYSPWNPPGHNTGVHSLSLLKGIFPTQGLNSGLLHCRWILYQLSYQGSLSIWR